MRRRRRIQLVVAVALSLAGAAMPATAAAPEARGRDLTVTVATDPANTARGRSVTVDADLRNDGRSAIQHPQLALDVPVAFSVVSTSDGASHDGTAVLVRADRLQPGESLSLQVVVRAEEPGTHDLVVTGSGSGVAEVAAVAAVEVSDQECLRFGVYPGNSFSFGKYFGLRGAEGKARYGDEAWAAMHDLAGGRAFDIHFYASWREGEELAPWTAVPMLEAHRRGFRVNLALKYLPPEGRDGDIQGFANWVAAIVAAHPEITTIQVTNEANSPTSTDSDGGSKDPLGALIEGVKAAAEVKAPHQEVGFNWFYRLDPVSDRQFWSTLGDRGGDAFREALDWAGVDIYAGTYVPPLESVDDEAEFRTALEYTRNEMMPLAGLGEDVPLYVQETGFPTLGPARTEQRQADALAAYIRATEGLNVALIQWFELADARSTLDDGWGLLRSDYTRKPAYDVMQDAVQSRIPC